MEHRDRNERFLLQGKLRHGSRHGSRPGCPTSLANGSGISTAVEILSASIAISRSRGSCLFPTPLDVALVGRV